MPQSVQIGFFVLGAVLLLVACLGGAFKIFGAEITANASGSFRFLAFILSVIFLTISYYGTPTSSHNAAPTPPPTGTPVPEPTSSFIPRIATPTPLPPREDNPQTTSTPPAKVVLNPILPSSPATCPFAQGQIWMRSPNTWHGPFGNGEAIMFSSAGGFMVWDPTQLNEYGTFGRYIPYSDPYLQFPRNVWVPLQQSRFQVCVDTYGNVLTWHSQ